MSDSLLDGLRRHTTVVADTADFMQLHKYLPQDATTNPSLILKAVSDPKYGALLRAVCDDGKGATLNDVSDSLLVRFGRAILESVPGRVSTEVDARLSFDADATVERAQRIIRLYATAGVPRARVLIKIAATWEGIQAARVLEAQGVRCNLTLVFGLHQAMACAEAGVCLISPFVGRIYDWHKQRAGDTWDEEARSGERDPGVQSVHRIYAQYKKFGVPTEVMAASFRNPGQILALAGCDLMTISPALLDTLARQAGSVERKLDPTPRWSEPLELISMPRERFDLELQADDMAREKLAEGIAVFCEDARILDDVLQAQLTLS